MNHTNEIQEKLSSYSEQIDLNKLFKVGPIVKRIWANCSLDNEQINLAWEKYSLGIILPNTVITLNPPKTGNKVHLEWLKENYNSLLNNSKYTNLKLSDVRAELFFLIVLLYEYYWVLDGLEIRYYIDAGSIHSNKTRYDELIGDMFEIADAMGSIMAIDDAIDEEGYIHVNGNFKIEDEGILMSIKASLEEWITGLKPCKTQLSLSLLQAYDEYRKGRDNGSLSKEIKMVKGIQKKDFKYLINDSISEITLLVREFLVVNRCLSKTPLMPKVFLEFVVDIFKLLNITTISMDISEDTSQVIRHAVRYYIKKQENSKGK